MFFKICCLAFILDRMYLINCNVTDEYDKFVPKKNGIHSIPDLYVKGNYFEVGYSIGRNFGDLIKQNMDNSKLLQRSVLAYNTKRGKSEYKSMLINAEILCPQQLRQIHGMSLGAKIPFYKLMLYQLSDELLGGHGNDTRGSSTLLINSSKQQFFFDVDLEEKFVNYFVIRALIDPAADEMGGEFKAESIQMISYVKAGTLPGQLITLYLLSNRPVVTVNREFRKMVSNITPLLIPVQAAAVAKEINALSMDGKDKSKIQSSLYKSSTEFLKRSGIRSTHYSLDVNVKVHSDISKRLCFKLNMSVESEVTEDPHHRVQIYPLTSTTQDKPSCDNNIDCYNNYLDALEDHMKTELQLGSKNVLPFSSDFIHATGIVDYTKNEMKFIVRHPKEKIIYYKHWVVLLL